MLLNNVFQAFDSRGLLVQIADSYRTHKYHVVTVVYDGPRDLKAEAAALQELGGWIEYEISDDKVVLNFARQKR